MESYTQATSVASNGTSATFQFPPNSSGGSLITGLYGYVLQNQMGPGVYTDVGGDALTIGSATTLTAPYGVAAINSSIYTDVCILNPITHQTTCTSDTANVVKSLVTLVNSSELYYAGTNLTVGSQPTAVQAYRTTTYTTGTCGTGTCVKTTQPSLALVANSGSNTVSVVSILPATGVTTTVDVGTQPVAILIDGTQTYAYVANLGSNTVSQISLSTNKVTGTVAVGSTPTSLALDPSGTAFWVGGLNYVSKVDTSNLSTATTYAVSGQVTSLSISAAQNAYVYTLLSGSTFSGAHASLATGVPHTDYKLPVGGDKVKPLTSLPTWINIGGPLVSVSYGNRYIVEGTPNGFAVLDIESDAVMMQGTTADPIVGIAVDPEQETAYATETNANTLLSIPLPPVQ